MDQGHEDFLLPRRQGRMLAGTVEDAIEEAPGFAFTQVAVSGNDRAQPFEEFRIERILAEIAVCTELHEFRDVLLLTVHGQDQDFDIIMAAPDFPQTVDAIHDRHGKVQQDDVDRRVFQPLQDFLSVRGFGDDMAVVLRGQQ